jgi:hypothetical protein
MTTFNWQGKEYKVVPDKEAGPSSPCGSCCFKFEMAHRCSKEAMDYPDGSPVQPCDEGEHHYEEVVT